MQKWAAAKFRALCGNFLPLTTTHPPREVQAIFLETLPSQHTASHEHEKTCIEQQLVLQFYWNRKGKKKWTKVSIRYRRLHLSDPKFFLAHASSWFTHNNGCDPRHLYFFNLKILSIGFCLSDTQALSRTAPFASNTNAELVLSNTTASTLKFTHSRVCTPRTSGVFSVKIQL